MSVTRGRRVTRTGKVLSSAVKKASVSDVLKTPVTGNCFNEASVNITVPRL
jgi:hypothetical protein